MGKIFCLMGKSAVGKDTLFKMVRAARPALKEYVMYTTRPMRDGETDGVTYHFTDETFLDKMRRDGKLIESRTYGTVHGPWSYATVDDGQIDLLKGDYLMPSTLESYLRLGEYFGKDRVIPLYIELEDGARLERALGRERGQKEPKYRELCRRFLADSEDFSEEKLFAAGIKKRYVNERLETCADELIKEIDGEGDA